MMKKRSDEKEIEVTSQNLTSAKSFEKDTVDDQCLGDGTNTRSKYEGTL